MRIKKHIRSDDMVSVITGAQKGKSGKVLRIVKNGQRVIVEGVNMVHKHVRRSEVYPNGGRIEKEASLALSNVLLLCPSCGRGVRTSVRVDNGRKIRVCRKCHESIG